MISALGLRLESIEVLHPVKLRSVCRDMKRLTRIILLFGLSCVVLLTLAGGASWWIMRHLGPEFWVQQIERATACRSEIAEASLNLFSKPARLSLRDVRLMPKDVPSRPEPEVPIYIPEVILEVRLDDLLNRRFYIEKLSFLTPVIRESIDAKGQSTLESLFVKRQMPEGTGSSHEVSRSIPLASAPPMGAQGTRVHPEPKELEKAQEQFSFSMQSAVIEDGTLTILNDGSTVVVSDLDFELTGVDLDPQNLAEHNQMLAKLSAAAKISCWARLAGARQQATLADVRLNATSQIRPLNPSTGAWQPSSLVKMTFDRGSVIAGHMTMGDAASKEMRKLQEYGIDLSPVRVGGALQEAAVVEGAFVNNRFSLTQDAKFLFPEYEVSLRRKSYVNAAADQHEIELRLSCGSELEGRLQQGLEKAQLGESITRGVIKALADEKGRMAFDIESEGSLSDPQIKPKVDRILKNLIRGEGLGDLLQGLLKKL